MQLLAAVCHFLHLDPNHQDKEEEERLQEAIRLSKFVMDMDEEEEQQLQEAFRLSLTPDAAQGGDSDRHFPANSDEEEEEQLREALRMSVSTLPNDAQDGGGAHFSINSDDGEGVTEQDQRA
jgi:hypothetical protein